MEVLIFFFCLQHIGAERCRLPGTEFERMEVLAFDAGSRHASEATL